MPVARTSGARTAGAHDLGDAGGRECADLGAPAEPHACRTTSAPAATSPPRGRTLAPGHGLPNLNLVAMDDNVLDGERRRRRRDDAAVAIPIASPRRAGAARATAAARAP